MSLQVLNAYGKVYPTPPPSRRPIRVKQARLAAEKAAKQGDEEEVDGEGTAKQETDKEGRHKLGMLLHPALPVLGNFFAWLACAHDFCLEQALRVHARPIWPAFGQPVCPFLACAMIAFHVFLSLCAIVRLRFPEDVASKSNLQFLVFMQESQHGTILIMVMSLAITTICLQTSATMKGTALRLLTTSSGSERDSLPTGQLLASYLRISCFSTQCHHALSCFATDFSFHVQLLYHHTVCSVFISRFAPCHV